MRDQMFRTLRRCFVLLLLGMALWSVGQHEANASEPPAPNVPVAASEAAADESSGIVRVVLPDFIGGDAEAHDLMVEVYAARLVRAGFSADQYDACECLYGPATVEQAVRDELRLDYPAVYGDVWWI